MVNTVERITHEQARSAAIRLINSHFNNPDQAKCSIPCDKNDDDILLMDYIGQQVSNSAAMNAQSVQPATGDAAMLAMENATNENLLRFYIRELKKTYQLVDELIEVLTDAHSYVEPDVIRERVGKAIIVARNFKVGK